MEIYIAPPKKNLSILLHVGLLYAVLGVTRYKSNALL